MWSWDSYLPLFASVSSEAKWKEQQCLARQVVRRKCAHAHQELSALLTLGRLLLILLDPTGGKCIWFTYSKYRTYRKHPFTSCLPPRLSRNRTFFLITFASSVMLGTGPQWLWAECLKGRCVLTRRAYYLRLAGYEWQRQWQWQWPCSQVWLQLQIRKEAWFTLLVYDRVLSSLICLNSFALKSSK